MITRATVPAQAGGRFTECERVMVLEARSGTTIDCAHARWVCPTVRGHTEDQRAHVSGLAAGAPLPRQCVAGAVVGGCWPGLPRRAAVTGPGRSGHTGMTLPVRRADRLGSRAVHRGRHSVRTGRPDPLLGQHRLPGAAGRWERPSDLHDGAEPTTPPQRKPVVVAGPFLRVDAHRWAVLLQRTDLLRIAWRGGGAVVFCLLRGVRWRCGFRSCVVGGVGRGCGECVHRGDVAIRRRARWRW
jgi:hypothetical protein